MSHYREINRELVDEVRRMRKEMKLYHNEIIRVKGELLEKHESEVHLRKQCYNWAVYNFVQLIQTIQPDSDILPVLKEHVQSHERVSSTLSSTAGRVDCRPRTSSERASRTRRSSTLTMDLQRSVSVMNLRKSLCSTSPIRKSNESVVEEVERNSQYFQRTTEVDQNMKSTENELLQSESLRRPSINSDVDDIIYEDSNEEDADVESIWESIEEVDTTQIRSTLKDVTNTLTSTLKSSKQENSLIKTVQKRELFKKTKTQNLSDGDKSMELCSDSDIEQKTTKLVELPRSANGEESLGTKKSFPTGPNNNHTDKEVSINSPNSIYNDITLKHFENLACSTPNSVRNSLLYSPPPTLRAECTTESGSENTSARPSRKCKPKSLEEPKLGTKLRSEKGQPKPKPKNKSKSKSKKS